MLLTVIQTVSNMWVVVVFTLRSTDKWINAHRPYIPYEAKTLHLFLFLHYLYQTCIVLHLLYKVENREPAEVSTVQHASPCDERLSVRPSIRLSVYICLSVKRVDCDKTKQTSAIYAKSMHLVF